MLTPGTRLGVYEVVAAIGEGGIGAVFRPRDTKLDRDVAVKILPEAFAHDADRGALHARSEDGDHHTPTDREGEPHGGIRAGGHRRSRLDGSVPSSRAVAICAALPDDRAGDQVTRLVAPHHS